MSEEQAEYVVEQQEVPAEDGATLGTETEDTGVSPVEVAEEEGGEEEGGEPIMVPLKALRSETKKRQELEARLQEVESRLSASNPATQTEAEVPAPVAPSELVQRYINDPQGTIGEINRHIVNLQKELPYADNPEEVATAIEYWRDQKVELKDQARAYTEQTVSRYQQNLVKAVPNINEKTPKLTQFATAQLGYTNDELLVMSNPRIVGESAAIKFVTTINKMYEQATAAETVKTKAVQPQPTQVESAGTGGVQNQTSRAKLKEQAIQSGDWTQYLAATGNL